MCTTATKHSMDPACLVSIPGCCWCRCNDVGMFSSHTLSLPINHQLNVTAHPSVFFFWPCASLFNHNLLSCNGHFQQDKAPRQTAKVISTWFHEHDNELWTSVASSVTKCESSGTRGMWQNRSFSAWMCHPQIWRNHVNVDHNLNGMYTKTCGIHVTSHRELRLF